VRSQAPGTSVWASDVTGLSQLCRERPIPPDGQPSGGSSEAPSAEAFGAEAWAGCF